MIREVGGAVGRNAAAKAGQAVTGELLGKCPKNKKGEYSTGYSKIVKGLFYFLCIFGGICGIFVKILNEISEEKIKREDELLINIVLIVGTCIFVSIFIFCRKIMFYKYTLTQEGLLIKKVFSKQLIGYTQLKESIEKWPATQYKGEMIFIINDEILKVPYAGLVGGIEFIGVLLYILKIDYLSVEMLVNKMKSGIVKNTKEERRAYKQRKAYIKSANRS